jgi:hypothetical protein
MKKASQGTRKTGAAGSNLRGASKNGDQCVHFELEETHTQVVFVPAISTDGTRGHSVREKRSRVLVGGSCTARGQATTH